MAKRIRGEIELYEKKRMIYDGYIPQGADLLPPPLRVLKTGTKHLDEEITPPSPHWDRREI
jgi:hypothetical protein